MVTTAEAQRARSDAASGALPDVEIPYETFTLGNGLRVVVSTDRKAPVVAVGVWYAVGSRDEHPGITGFAHLFEHLFTRHRRDDSYRIAETTARLHWIECRHDVQHGQVCVVPSREGGGMGERANRGIAEINRADYLFEFDHDTLRS